MVVSSTSFALLQTVPGPPSPPDSVTVEEVTDCTAQLAWSRGRDNGSPIVSYFVQTRTPFTVGWQRVNTGEPHTPCTPPPSVPTEAPPLAGEMQEVTRVKPVRQPEAFCSRLKCIFLIMTFTPQPF